MTKTEWSNMKWFATRFSNYSDWELIDAFNKEVWNKWWASVRAEYLSWLHKEFDARWFDYSEIGDLGSLSFKEKIMLEGNIIRVI